jgi:hypothetical protein
MLNWYDDIPRQASNQYNIPWLVIDSLTSCYIKESEYSNVNGENKKLIAPKKYNKKQNNRFYKKRIANLHSMEFVNKHYGLSLSIIDKIEKGEAVRIDEITYIRMCFYYKEIVDVPNITFRPLTTDKRCFTLKYEINVELLKIMDYLTVEFAERLFYNYKLWLTSYKLDELYRNGYILSTFLNSDISIS